MECRMPPWSLVESIGGSVGGEVGSVERRMRVYGGKFVVVMIDTV